MSSTPTHCSFRDKATNGIKPCFCQLTIHWGLLNLRSVFSSADRGWHFSLAKQLKLGGWTVALSWIIQKNVFEFNSSPTPPQTELITPSFRITVLACTYLCYCADHIVLYCIIIIYLHVFLSSWTRDSFMMRTVYIFLSQHQAQGLYSLSVLNQFVKWMNEWMSYLALPTTINVHCYYCIWYQYELPTYSVSAVGNFLIRSALVSISLVEDGYKSCQI